MKSSGQTERRWCSLTSYGARDRVYCVRFASSHWSRSSIFVRLNAVWFRIFFFFFFSCRWFRRLLCVEVFIEERRQEKERKKQTKNIEGNSRNGYIKIIDIARLLFNVPTVFEWGVMAASISIFRSGSSSTGVRQRISFPEIRSNIVLFFSRRLFSSSGYTYCVYTGFGAKVQFEMKEESRS